MTANIHDFVAAVDQWSEQVGGEADIIVPIVLLAVGRWYDHSECEYPSIDDPAEKIQSGELRRRYRSDFERKLQTFTQETGVLEDFLIVGAVCYVERFLEGMLENAPKHRKSMEALIERYGGSQPEHDSDDQLQDLYARPRTLKELKKYREHLEAWRFVVVPILNV